MFPRGVYVLVLRVPKCSIRVGSLGELTLAGTYAYIGSNQRGGRIERHLRKGKKKRWHVDHLTEVGVVEEIVVLPGVGKEVEEILARRLERFPFIPEFGNSDCRDRSHLFRFSPELKREVIRFCGELRVRPLFCRPEGTASTWGCKPSPAP